MLTELGRRGYATVGEPGRRVVREELERDGSALPWTDLAAFLCRAFEVVLQDFEYASGRTGQFFLDRGFINAAARLERAMGASMTKVLGSSHRYYRRAVIAPRWPEGHVTDAMRRHDFKPAMVEHENFVQAFPSLGCEVTVLPKVSVVERIDLIIPVPEDRESRCDVSRKTAGRLGSARSRRVAGGRATRSPCKPAPPKGQDPTVFKCPEDLCNVRDREKLTCYRAHARRWCDSLDTDEAHAISKQPGNLMWHDAVFRRLNGARRLDGADRSVSRRRCLYRASTRDMWPVKSTARWFRPRSACQELRSTAAEAYRSGPGRKTVPSVTRVPGSGGESAADELLAKLGARAETVRGFACRLYTICERKKRAAEALAYHGLVQSWPEIVRLAPESGNRQRAQAEIAL